MARAASAELRLDAGARVHDGGQRRATLVAAITLATATEKTDELLLLRTRHGGHRPRLACRCWSRQLGHGATAMGMGKYCLVAQQQTVEQHPAEIGVLRRPQHQLPAAADVQRQRRQAVALEEGERAAADAPEQGTQAQGM